MRGCRSENRSLALVPTLAALVAALALVGAPGAAQAVQIVLFGDNFSVSQGTAWTTSGQIGTSGWQVNRSGADWGGRIDGGVLALTNTASATANVSGWVSATRSNAGFGEGFSSTLGTNVQPVEWFFNFQQPRLNPGGFNSGSYGVAVVLATNSTSLFSNGVGYAVVLGNVDTPDPVRLVRFTSGLNPNSGITTLVTAPAGSGLLDPTTSHLSIRVIYDPDTDQWALYGRNDGGSFADPRAGTLTALGSATDATHTNLPMENFGFYWQGSTTANQTARFDNFSILLTPEPGRTLLLAVAALALLGRRRR